MTTYNTGNPLGSSAAKDLYDNAQNLDFALNKITESIWVDRFGRQRQSWYGIEQSAKLANSAFGYITIDSFEEGATLTLPNQVLRWKNNGEYYRWDGTYLPSGKIVPPSSTPESTGGISRGAWVSVGDAALRALLSSDDVNYGDAMIRVKQPYSGSFSKSQHEKNAEFVTLKDAGAIGDGVVNDTASFTKFESWFQGDIVDLHGLSYVVDNIPTGNIYINGEWVISNVNYPVQYSPIKKWGNLTVLSDNSLPNFDAKKSSSQSLLVFGRNAALAAIESQGGVILGQDAHKDTVHLPYQTIAIGRGVLQVVQPASSNLSEILGNRNIGIGAYSLRFLSSGYQNVSIGRNTGSGITTGYQNTLMGTGAISGEAPVGLSGEIVNIQDMVGFRGVGIGYNAGKNAIEATDSVYVGGRAGQSFKKGTFNTIVGAGAAINVGNDTAINGNLYKSTSTIGGTYSQSGTTITINLSSAHGAAAGDVVQLAFTSGQIATDYTTDLVYSTVGSVPTSTSMTVISPVSLTTSGTVNLRGVVGQVPGNANGNNTIGGFAACASMIQAGGVTAWGYRAAENLTSSNYGTFIGRYAGSSILGGNPNTSFGDNVTAIGNVSPLSGNNQVQLGNADTTVYYYQLAQRSDARDKDVIGVTSLGLDFIRKLRFVDYIWDMREDYVEIVETTVPEVMSETVEFDTGKVDDEGNSIIGFKKVNIDGERTEVSFVKKEKDGSKKRKRTHHGLISQEVGQVLKDLGIDSAIFQDHEINGGLDVKSLAYLEMIAPMGRAIQQLDVTVTNLKNSLEEALKRLETIETK